MWSTIKTPFITLLHQTYLAWIKTCTNMYILWPKINPSEQIHLLVLWNRELERKMFQRDDNPVIEQKSTKSHLRVFNAARIMHAFIKNKSLIVTSLRLTYSPCIETIISLISKGHILLILQLVRYYEQLR